MTNSAMTASTEAAGVAGRIERARKIEGRSVAWLSEKTGIAYKTLRRRLYGAPEQFTIAELNSIARALDRSLEWLIVESAAQDRISA